MEDKTGIFIQIKEIGDFNSRIYIKTQDNDLYTALLPNDEFAELHLKGEINFSHFKNEKTTDYFFPKTSKYSGIEPREALEKHRKEKQPIDISMFIETPAGVDNCASPDDIINKYADMDRDFSTKEQDDIESRLSGLSDDELKEMIRSRQGKPRKATESTGTTPVRDHFLMELYKRKYGYACQFCSTTIEKANGKHYIEACHITPVGKDGSDDNDNILVLCPNCHKLFDYGKREVVEHTKSLFVVKLNGHEYKATF
jgi:5-methylcytosine-specific restriction endonuclease McrA